MKNFEKRRKAQRSGFTLIELVMVVMILAIVAGLAVPIVGWLRRAANYGAQANIQAAIAQNLEFYRTTYGNNAYPNHLDSLFMANGDDAPTTIIGTGDSNIATDGLSGTLTPLTLDGGSDMAQCAKAIECVYDHATSGWLQGNPSNSAITERELDYSTGNDLVFASIDRTSGNGIKLFSEWYGTNPDEWPDAANIQHLAFGIGPYCDLVGTTLQSAPMDPRVDASKKYGRFVAVFAVYQPRNGRRAQLKGVINGKGRSANNALSEFWVSTNP